MVAAPMSEQSSSWFGNSTTQPYFEKTERVLDQEIAFQSGVYKNASLTAFHTILFAIFLVFAQQYVGLLNSIPRGWLLRHLPAHEIALALVLPILALASFAVALLHASNLQFSDEVRQGRRARTRTADLRSDVPGYMMALPSHLNILSSGSGELAQLG
jgi:hypothetical protein